MVIREKKLLKRVEIELDKYDQMLGSIDSQMGAMKSQQSFIQISDVNQTRLVFRGFFYLFKLLVENRFEF